jgi:hypothetical protein
LLICAQHQNEGVAALKKVSNLLETAQFTSFWTLIEEDATLAGLLKNFPGFSEAIQSCTWPGVSFVPSLAVQSADS